MNVTFTIDSRRANFRVDTTFILGSEYNVAFSDAIQRRVVLYAHNGQPVADTADGSTLSLDTAELLEQFKINGIESKCPRTITVHCCIIDSDGDTIAIGDVQVMYSRFYTAPNGTLTAIDTKGEQGIPGPQGIQGEDGRDGVVTDISAGYVAFTVPSEGPNAGHLVAHVADLNDFYAKDINGQPDTTKPRWVVRDDGNGKRHLYYCIYTEDGNARAIDLGSVQGPQGIQGEAGEYNFDNGPTLNSTNPVTSSGIFIAIDNERARAEQAEEALRAKITAVYKYKGSVATKEALPTASATVGDVWNVEADGANYAYNGNGVWDALGSFVDLSEYAKSQDVANAIQNTAQSLSNNLQAEVEKLKTQLASKVNVEAGKGLSTFDFSNAHKAKLEGIEAGAQKNPDLTPYAKTGDVNTGLNKKVDKVDGKGLSSNDYTTQEKNDLADLKAKRFDIAVNGIRQPPVEGLVNVLTNYKAQVVEPDDQGVAYIYPNRINNIKVTATQSDVSEYIDDYDMLEGQPEFNPETWEMSIGSLRHKYSFFNNENLSVFGDEFACYVDGYNYNMDTFPRVVSAVVTKLDIQNANPLGECEFDANITLEFEGLKIYIPDAHCDMFGSVFQFLNKKDGILYDFSLPLMSIVTKDTPIGSELTLTEPNAYVSYFNASFQYVLVNRSPIKTNVKKIVLAGQPTEGIADYLARINIPFQARNIEISSLIGASFVAPTGDALLLDGGENLLVFTQMDDSTFFVNRLLIAEVGQ